ncbi:hypothetical protein [Polaromonas sp.]|uniref:hypothetical protein n=1 Tax=Polaromonas sp. TaxID=1869339 RepID=UPI0035626036
MARKFFALLLLLSVFWQSAGMAGSAAALGSVEASSHTVQHWQDAEHHHHDDGSLHADDSDGTAQHMHAESGANTTGLVSLGWRDLVMQRPAAPRALASPPHPSPHPRGLLRPPQAA